MMALLLSACTSQTPTPSSPPPTSPLIQPTAVAASEISPGEDATQTGATSTRDKVGFILGNLLILSLYSFPMSYAEEWAFGDPRNAKKRPKHESPESIVSEEASDKPAQTIGEETPASVVERITSSELLPQWVRNLPRVTAGLAAGGCLMVVVVIVGAVAFALYYLFSGQPENVSQILPRFAYWFPFALLGMVTNTPFKIIYWEDRRLRVLLRLMMWWFPRIVIVAFVINPPILQGLDPANTALTVLAIDGVLAAFCLGLYAAREQMAMGGVQ
jgi:hypothetical protein